MIPLAVWRKHVDQVVATAGQWVGVCDGHGLPLFDVPGVLSVRAPQQRHDHGECEVRFVNLTPVGGEVSPIVSDLAGDNLSKLDREGALSGEDLPPRLLVVARPTGRTAYFVTHVELEGGVASPAEVVIHGVYCTEQLAAWPCPSVRHTWVKPFTVWREDAVGAYETSRVLSRVELATKADAYTVSGPAVPTIRSLIQNSISAVNRLMGWGDSPHMVVDFSGSAASPVVLIRLTDSSVWDTISDACRNSGVLVDAVLWWPGDPPVQTFEGSRSWAHPMLVFRVDRKVA